MGLNKKYSGYKSYDYLEKDVDYRPFKLVKEIDRVEPYVVPLSPSEEERVNKLVGENVVISLHEHVQVRLEDSRDDIEFATTGRKVTGYEALSLSCLDCVFENIGSFVALSSKSAWSWDDGVSDLGMRLADIAHQDLVIVARTVDDILRAHREGKIAFALACESAASVGNLGCDRIEVLYGLGLRSMGLVFNDANALGSGMVEDRDGGLTDFGRRCVERMNKLGMLVDCAHCGTQTTLDAVAASKKPIVASHTGARALSNIRRMFPDDVLKAIADKGGLVGIECAPHTTLTQRHPEQSIESVMEHFEYIKDLVGIDHVTFGPDTHYGDHVRLHHNMFRRAPALSNVFAVTAPHGTPYVKGAENPTECFWNFPRWLVKHKYSDEDIAKVLGGNTLRVLREVWC